MEKFKPVYTQIRTEKKEGQKSDVVPIDESYSKDVQDYSLKEFGHNPTYNLREIRSRLSESDQAFKYSSLLRESVAAEQSEERHIQAEVERRVSEMVEDAKKKGYDAGFQQGLQDGIVKAKEDFQAQAKDHLVRFETLVNSFEGMKNQIFQAHEKFLMELIFRVARMVVLKEIKTDPEYVLRVSKVLIEKLGVKNNIHIKIHPQDLETIGLLKKELEGLLGGLTNLSIETSPKVRTGGCLIETEWNAIDASIETQLEAVQKILTERSESNS